MDFKEAKRSATTLLRSARTRVAGGVSTGRELSASMFAELKAKAARAAEKAPKFDNYFSGGSSSSSAPGVSRNRPGAGGLRSSRPAGLAEETAVEKLCALGFSAAAVRHALRRCGGRVEEAGVWLFDEASADEILAAEVAAREADPLRPGSTARISGLRGAAHLNGLRVTLRTYDDESQRWVVQMDDGAMKAIRPRNLDPEPASDGKADVATQPMESQAVGGGSGVNTPAKPAAANREALLAQVRTLTGGELDAEAAASLSALSEEELLEVIASLSMERHQASAAAKPHHKEHTSSSVGGAAVVSAPATGQVEEEYAALKRQLQESAERIATQEGLHEEKAAALEAREAALLESQARWRAEAKAEAEQIRLFEEGEEEMRGKQPVITPSLAVAEGGSACQIESAAAAPAESGAGRSTARADEERTLEERRAELEELQAKALSAAKELEIRQEASRRNAEERELRLLEAEEEHLRISDLLRDEQARLEQERRKVMLLQRSLLVTASSPSSFPSGAGASVGGEGAGASEIRSYAIDDGASDEAPEARPRRKSTGGRKSIGGRRTLASGEEETLGEQEATFADKSEGSLVDNSAAGATAAASEDDDDYDDYDQESEGEEVWDLDWSTLTPTPAAAASFTPSVSGTGGLAGTEQTPQAAELEPSRAPGCSDTVFRASGPRQASDPTSVATLSPAAAASTLPHAFVPPPRVAVAVAASSATVGVAGDDITVSAAEPKQTGGDDASSAQLGSGSS